MPRKPLEPDDRLRNCLPMASGRGGTTREPVKKEDWAKPTDCYSGRGLPPEHGDPEPRGGGARKAGRNPGPHLA